MDREIQPRPFPHPLPHPLPPIDCLPWPLPEPPPEPGDLDQEINWRAFPHHELYDMVNNGLDLERVNDVAAQWSRLGGELADIGHELRRALDVAADGWQGAAAEQTRETVRRLAIWTEDTADASTTVCGCVAEQAALAVAAQRDMPPPQPHIHPYAAVDRYADGGDFRGGPMLVEDPEPDRQRAQEMHRQAAEVMARYQHQSREVYGRVPTFAGPEDGRLTHGEDEEPNEPPPRSDSPGDGTSASAVAGAAPTPGVPAGESVSGAVPPGRSGESYAHGMRASALASASGPLAGTTAGSAGSRATGPSAMPMGAGGSRSREEDAEHHSPAYLREDTDDVWGAQTPVTPPVIGERAPEHGSE